MTKTKKWVNSGTNCQRLHLCLAFVPFPFKLLHQVCRATYKRDQIPRALVAIKAGG